jgi:ATP synthase F1 epsilon subunit
MAEGGAAKTFDLSLVTPEGAAYEGEAEMLVVPGEAGEIGVLARHAPLIALLRAGETRVRTGPSQWQSYATGPGFFKVQRDRAIVLVDEAVSADDIDPEQARREAEEARAALEAAGDDPDVDRWRLEQQLRHAENKLVIAGR